MPGQNKTSSKVNWQCPICQCSWTVLVSASGAVLPNCPYCLTLGKTFSEALRILKKMSWLDEIHGDSRMAVEVLDRLDWRTQLLVWVCPHCHHAYVATLFQRLQGKACSDKSCPNCHDQSEQG